jgi:hypothetical protein
VSAPGDDRRWPATHGGGRPRAGVRSRVTRWVRDLALGVQLAAAGGREARLRVGLTALGVGLGVAMLLLAASVPAMLEARDAREQQRTISGIALDASDDTLLLRHHMIEFRGHRIHGWMVQPEGPAAPVPPGLAELPAPGELVVSPALARLLDSPDGELLRPRLDQPVVGEIGDDGLVGPRELTFYLGDDTLAERQPFTRTDGFGAPGSQPDRLTPMLLLLLVVGVVTLLLPIVMFVAAAARSGGEQRDRRLAALRLVGADGGMTRRIAAGEALVGSLLGLGVGAAAFGAGRLLVEWAAVGSVNVFAADARPDPMLAVLVLLAVPVLAVAVTLLAMRGVVAEPLGVVRRSAPVQRKLWWRVALPVAGLALLLSLSGQATVDRGQFAVVPVMAGAVLTLLGVASLLPWLVDRLVRRSTGGGVSWQLAMRRLQLGAGSTGRVATGVAVAAAGAIALQMVFGAAAGVSVTATQTGGGQPAHASWLQAADPTHLAYAQLASDRVDDTATQQAAGRFAQTAGVRHAASVRQTTATVDGAAPATVAVGDCPALTLLADLDRCDDGDVFLLVPVVQPGQELTFGHDETEQAWTVPGHAAAVAGLPDPLTFPVEVLATPAAGVPEGAGSLVVYLDVEPDPDAIEHVRNTAASIDPFMGVHRPVTVRVDEDFLMLQRALLVGVTLTLLLVGLSLLVSTVEQLRERRRQLAVLAAFGAQRRTLAWSVLWQAAVPVVLGMLLAVVAGIGLGTALLSIVSGAGGVDPGYLAAIVGIAAATVLAVTALTLPVLWRLMRTEGLRTE